MAALERTIEQAEELLAADDRAAALDLLLEALEQTPLEPRLHALLELAVKEHELRERPKRLPSNTTRPFMKIRDRIPRRAIERGYILYGLPELGRVDDALLADLPSPGPEWVQRGDWRGLSVPERLGAKLPLHEPESGDVGVFGIPGIDLQDELLTVTQRRRLPPRAGEDAWEAIHMRIYRVRGSLFHARRGRWTRREL